MIAETPDQVAERMTTERVPAQKDAIERHYQSAHTKAEVGSAVGAHKPQRFPRIMGQKHDKDQGQIEKVAMDILKNERKPALTPIALSRLANRTGDRVGPEGF